VIVGEGSQREALEALARECDVAARVEFRGRLTDAEVRALYARAGAVFYAPWDEDYGLVTLEAFHARKPVVTAADAGGVLEFVTDGKSGEVAEADPTALGARLKRLLADPEQARRQGESGYARVQGIRWTDVISRLTAPLRE
jgi:glycosyltransferase involved in cell wall biosynthesis